MSHGQLVRVLLAAGAVVLFLSAGVLLLLLAETLLELWQRLALYGGWAQGALVAIIATVCLLFGFLLYRLLFPRRSGEEQLPDLPDEDNVQHGIARARELGIDTSEVEAELARLGVRREAGEIHVAFLGEISTGKSALIRALTPDAEAVSGVVGGTTRRLTEYRWESAAGDRLVLVDMPGLNEAGGGLDPLAEEEALRAHVVVFVVNGDLTRSERTALRGLEALGKPLIVALNKSDRLDDRDLELVRTRLGEHLGPDVPVVAVQSGGEQTVVRIMPDGSEERVVRERPARVNELARAMQRIIDSHSAILDGLRDSSVFVLAARKLDAATAERRREEAATVVRSYSRKAVVGALAAVTPGSDIVIQGILASQMIRELSRLYDVPVRKVDVDTLIELVQRHVGKTVTLVLAVAGNAFKAFPGIGTIAGGLMHAVAYGMVFDTLGRAVADSLAVRGELRPLQVATRFKEVLAKEAVSENLEQTAQRLARLALEQAGKPER